MVKFPLKDKEVLLVHLESDTEGLLLAINHHAALQEVKHNIYEPGLQVVHYLEKLNEIILYDLKLITRLIAGQSTLLRQGVIYLPLLEPRILIFAHIQKEDFVRASNNEHLIFVELRLTNCVGRDSLCVALVRVLLVNENCVALSVEGEYHSL